jgi:hypothetical protein
MTSSATQTKEKTAEVIGLLTAISIVAKRLAANLSKLETPKDAEAERDAR